MGILLPLLAVLPVRTSFAASNYVVLAWNNLGMHCMDSDFSIFSILPPYNTIHAQVVMILNGNSARLLTNPAGYGVTYEAVADPTGSFNSTSEGKGNFWEYVDELFGVALPPDTGLPVPGPSWVMPGTNNTPQDMSFEAGFNWFAAYGVPITPYDDAGKPNSYPLMRLRAKAGSAPLAFNDIVLPVSDEMDCKLCHLSGSGPAAMPAAGWVNHPDPGRDYRLNILRLHDERQSGNPLYAEALTARVFQAAGLVATVSGGKPILCAACHLSEALPASGYGSIPPLTEVVHGHHATVIDPRNGLMLESSDNRISCYTCHPGSDTRCLRGAMGKAVAPDGSNSMQCQSCHGSMSEVGSVTRTGWLDEPNCQACHTGDALSNSGQIRYTTVFDSPGHMRVPPNSLFATNPDTPASGFSLYRFSKGHGGLQCSACHGSTHAIFPSAFENDNLASIHNQSHAGTMAECTACHGTQSLSYNGGPHGMHPTTQNWAEDHADDARSGPGVSQCRVCHGANERGTVLSRAQGDRVISTKFGSRRYWKGQEISCYNCHNGSDESDPTTHPAPTATNVLASTTAGNPVAFLLPASPTGVRIVSQPANGTVGLAGNSATYYPGLGFSGQDVFTFCATNGYNESNLATGEVTVTEVDSVGDGIPDWWRKHHFGGDGTTTNDDSCAACDPDEDGVDNADERFADTNPNDGRSFVRMLPLEDGPRGVRYGFTTEIGKRYTIRRSEALPSTNWSPVVAGVWGRIDSTTLSDADALGQPREFYRAEVLP